MPHAPRSPRLLPSRLATGLRATLAPTDPVARPLTWATTASSTSQGVFYSVSALFFTRIIGLAPTTVGWGLTVAGAVGVAAGFGAGYLADRIGAARLLLLATAGQGLALLAYVTAAGTTSFVISAGCAGGLRSAQQTARQTVLVQVFTGGDRVQVRARLRVVTNVFIGVGTVVASLALLVGSSAAYRCAMVLAGLLVLAAAGPLIGLDRRFPRPSGRQARPSAPMHSRHAGSPPPRSPLRDRTYLAATGLNALMAMHFGLQTVGVPLWVAGYAHAPKVTVAALLVLNTVLVALFQVRAARGSRNVRTAGRLVARAGALLAVACGLYAAAEHRAAALAVVLLVLAVAAHTAAEVWSEAGSWSLAFELADERSAGAYQGVAQTGYALGAMLAPLVVTATAIRHGNAGWLALALIFLGAGASPPACPLERRAKIAHPSVQGPSVSAEGGLTQVASRA